MSMLFFYTIGIKKLSQYASLEQPFSFPKLKQCFSLPQCACDVICSEYSENDSLQNQHRNTDLRFLVIKGKVLAIQDQESQLIEENHWIEMKSRSQYSLLFLQDTVLVEFWMDPIN